MDAENIERVERRRYALLQAAATLVAAPQQKTANGVMYSYSEQSAVLTAETLLEIIERNEVQPPLAKVRA